MIEVLPKLTLGLLTGFMLCLLNHTMYEIKILSINKIITYLNQLYAVAVDNNYYQWFLLKVWA